MSDILINNDVSSIEQTYEEFLEEFKADPSITILSKNCLSLLNEYAQLNGEVLLFQVISQTGQSHQPM